MAEHIELEAVIEKIIRDAGLCAYNMLDGEAGGLLRAKDTLRKIPAADVAPVRHGRWEWIGPYRYNDDGMIGTCSVCKERLRLFAYNYCPNCGAKMDGGAD